MTQKTVAEALNELKQIDNKLRERRETITKYASKRLGDPDRIDGQAAYVEGIIQSAKDLIAHATHIRMVIQRSNLETTFEYGGKTMSIAEALDFKQRSYERLLSVNASINSTVADGLIRRTEQALQRGVNLAALSEEQQRALQLLPHLFYDELEVAAERADLVELHSNVDVLIEASNHATKVDI